MHIGCYFDLPMWLVKLIFFVCLTACGWFYYIACVLLLCLVVAVCQTWFVVDFVDWGFCGFALTGVSYVFCV